MGREPSTQREPVPRRGYLTTRLRPANTGYSPAHLARDIELNLVPHLPVDRGARILEVGFGFGAFLDYLATAGYSHYEGIDIDADCVEAVSGRHPVLEVDSAAEFLRERPASYDAIVLRDVIAHLDQEHGVVLVSRAREALAPTGRLILQTFNAALPSAHYTLSNDVTHRAAYTEYSLRQLLVMGGFDSIAILPGRIAVSALRGRLYLLARAAYCSALRLRMLIERGAGGNPTMYSKELVGVGRRD